MTFLDQVLAANAALVEGRDVPVPALPGGRGVAVVTCSEIRAPNGRDLASYLGLAPDEVVMVVNAGARVVRANGDAARSVAEALGRRGGGEVFVVAHEDCEFLDADPETVASLVGSLAGRYISAAEDLCGPSYVSARTVAKAAAEILRSSPFLGSMNPVHALVLDPGRGRLSLEQSGYGAAAPTAAAAPSLGTPPSPILGAPSSPGAGAPSMGGGFTPGPVSLMAPGPASIMGAAPSSLMDAPPPDLGAGSAGFAAPPPAAFPLPSAPIPFPVPPSFAAPPPPASAAPPSPPLTFETPPAPPSASNPFAFPASTRSEPPPLRREPPEDDDVPPPPPPRTPQIRTGPPKPPDVDDPFRRAAEVLERLRRERRK